MPKKQIREDWCSQCMIDNENYNSQICQESGPPTWLQWYVQGHDDYIGQRNGSHAGGCNLNAWGRRYDMNKYGCEDDCVLVVEEVPCDDVYAIQSNPNPNPENFENLIGMLEQGYKNSLGDGVCLGNGERICSVDEIESVLVPNTHVGQNTNGSLFCRNNYQILHDDDVGTSRPRATYGGPGTDFEATLAAGHIPLSYSDCCYLVHDMMYSMIPLTSVSGGDTNAAWAVIHADQVLLQNLKYVRDVLGEQGNSDTARAAFCASSDWDMSVPNVTSCCYPRCSWRESDCLDHARQVAEREADEFRRSVAHSLSETFGEALSSSDLSSVAAFLGIADTGLVGQLYLGSRREQIGKLERSLKVVKALKKATAVGRPIISNFGFLELGKSGVSNSWSLFKNDSGLSCNNDPLGYEAKGYCSTWAGRGYCTRSYVQFMQNNCSCSCGVGDSSPIYPEFNANDPEFYAEDFIGDSATPDSQILFLNNMRSIMSTYDSRFPYTPSSAPNGPWPTITTGC